MENDFDTIMLIVEEMESAELPQNGVFGVSSDVMCNNWRKCGPLKCENTTLEKDLVFVRQQRVDIYFMTPA
jgi:hypothetical protein